VHPKKVLYFGQDNLTVSGPCFASNIQIWTVKVGAVNVQCRRVSNGLQLQCELPYLPKLGSNIVSLTYNSIYYQSSLVVVDTDDGLVAFTSKMLKIHSNLDSAYSVDWNVADIPQSNTIVFRGFQVDYIINSGGQPLPEQIIPLHYGEHNNTGRVELYPESNPSVTSNFISTIYLVGIITSPIRYGLAIILVLAVPDICSSHCSSSTLSNQMLLKWQRLLIQFR